MNFRLPAQACLGVKVLYFGIAAATTIYVVAEAWHYGCFLTPFPAILTMLAMIFIGASVTGLLCFRSTVSKVIALSLLLAGWVVAVVEGSYFCSDSYALSTLQYFIPIVAFEIIGLLALMRIGSNCIPAQSLTLGTQKAIHQIGLLLPLPIIAYAGLSIYSCSLGSLEGFPQASEHAPTIESFIQGERFLFGDKRANHQCDHLLRHLH